MLLADFGTSYCKILDTGADASPRLVATRDLDRTFCADLATGHNAARPRRRSINELTALARGGVDQPRRQPAPLAGRDWGLMLGLGFSGYYLASYLDFLGLQYISAALERLILFAYPTLVVLFSAVFLGKPVTRRAAGAIALCYAGIALALAHDLDLAGAATDVWVGGALVFGSAVSYALYLMGNGQAVGRLGAARVTAWASTIACVLCLAHFAATRPLALLVQPAPVMALGAGMALLSTVVGASMLSADGLGGDPPPGRRPGVADRHPRPGGHALSRLADPRRADRRVPDRRRRAGGRGGGAGGAEELSAPRAGLCPARPPRGFKETWGGLTFS